MVLLTHKRIRILRQRSNAMRINILDSTVSSLLYTLRFLHYSCVTNDFCVWRYLNGMSYCQNSNVEKFPRVVI